MGRDIAEAVPEAMAVFERGSDACGLDLARLCSRPPGSRSMVDTERAAARAGRDEPGDPRGASREGNPAGLRRRALGRRVRRDRGGGLDSNGRGDRARSGARPGHGRGGRGSIPARWRRSSVWPTRSSRTALARGSTARPANYNCPGQVVVSGEAPAVDECCEEAEREGARRTVKLKVSGAFHSPLVARAADRLRPAIERVRFTEPTAPFMSTVTARIESAQRMAPLLVDQLTAPVRFTQAASELIREEGVKTFVEVGPSNVLSGLVKRIDRSVKAISVNNLESLKKLKEQLSFAEFCSLEGKTRARHRRLARHRPGDRARAGAGRRGGRRRLPVGAGTRRRWSRRRSAAGPFRRTSPIRSRPGARRGGRRPRHPRQQRGHHARRAARAHVRRRLARR